MEERSTKQRTAPGLQQIVIDFVTRLRWVFEDPDEKTLVATRALGGNIIRWCFHFEDDTSFSTSPPSPSVFSTHLIHKAQQHHFFDLIATDDMFASRHWRDYVRPDVERRFVANPNWKYGTTRALLNRFAQEISLAHQNRIDQLLREHFIQRPVHPSFVEDSDALGSIRHWIGSTTAPRLLLIKGDAGVGKSVFALMLVGELQRRFNEDPDRYPAPFLLRFSKDRPAILADLITLAVNDLGFSDSIPPEAVRYLLKQGRLLLVLDGFDEVSRALAENAKRNVEELSQDINKNTFGRLLLTSRPSFIVQEDIFSDLKHGCEEELHEERELAPYTDEQMREWVIQNAPRAEVAWPPERHWQRVRGALASNPQLHPLCRIPVFLRMLSEVLVKDRSVRSLYDLVEKFCFEMWERERGKRTLSLSDAQYCYAYEAVSVLAMEETRIDPRDVKTTLELYLQEYAPDLLAGTGGDAASLVADLAIGPLTYGAGVFTFVHEVFQAYFLARLLARSLFARRKIDDLWNRRIPDSVWGFLPDTVAEISGNAISTSGIIEQVVRPSKSGLVASNLIRALRVQWRELPRDLFSGKNLAGVVFERIDVRGMSFDDCMLYNVTFDRCMMDNTTFRRAKIKRVKLIQCGHGAVFDEVPRLDEDSEIQVLRSKEAEAELYVESEIPRFLGELTGATITALRPPANFVEQAMLVVFASLFKADGWRLDYPEPFKIENRLRAWVQSFGFSEAKRKELVKILRGMLPTLQKAGWIATNPNRPRTLVAPENRRPMILEATRRGSISGCDGVIDSIISSIQEQCDDVS